MSRQRHGLSQRFLICAILFLTLPLLLGFDFPKPTGFVTDAASLIATDQRVTLETELKQLEQDTGWEVAVVTVPTLEGATIERYAQDLFVAYGIGKKGTDNGVLLILARHERKVRIHTGYHAESVITDAIAKRIISETIAPKTKAEDWSGGITDGAHAIIKLIRDPAHNPDTAIGRSAPMSDSEGIILFLIALFVLCFMLFILIHYFNCGRSEGSPVYWSGYSSDDDGGSSGGFGGGDSGGGGASGDC